jgi:GTPase
MRMPVVAIVGRPNVGKSSLLNALLRRRVSIVQDEPGVTRDRVSVPYQVQGKWVELVDTGGYGFDDAQGLTEHIKHQIELAMARADLVIFVVDAHAGLQEMDKTIARLLREQGIKVVILANKTDGPKYEQALSDFSRLGLGTPIGVSATTGHNLTKLPEIIEKNCKLDDAPTEIPEPDMAVAIVGKRNAGKSTLVNAIASLFGQADDRVIVSEVPGTTRDSVDVRFEKDGKTLIVIDTAGVRKKRHMVNDDIEFYSFHRAERSIRRADVVFHLLDAGETISEPDKKLAGYIAEQHKPVVIVINKWDIAQDRGREQQGEKYDDSTLMEKFREYVDKELRGLSYAPIAFITAKESRKISALLDLARSLFKQSTTRLTTSRLNDAVQAVLQEKAPSAPGSKRPKVYYATQTDINPPTIVMFVNNDSYFNANYKRFVMNRFRELLPFEDVPMKLLFRQKEGRRSAGERELAKPTSKTDDRPRAAKPAKPAKAGRRGSAGGPVRGRSAEAGKPRKPASKAPGAPKKSTGKRQGKRRA